MTGSVADVPSLIVFQAAVRTLSGPTTTAQNGRPAVSCHALLECFIQRIGKMLHLLVEKRFITHDTQAAGAAGPLDDNYRAASALPPAMHTPRKHHHRPRTAGARKCLEAVACIRYCRSVAVSLNLVGSTLYTGKTHFTTAINHGLPRYTLVLW